MFREKRQNKTIRAHLQGIFRPNFPKLTSFHLSISTQD
jgi:hypothetical protein